MTSGWNLRQLSKTALPMKLFKGENYATRETKSSCY
jgi:hypothetical protein